MTTRNETEQTIDFEALRLDVHAQKAPTIENSRRIHERTHERDRQRLAAGEVVSTVAPDEVEAALAKNTQRLFEIGRTHFAKQMTAIQAERAPLVEAVKATLEAAVLAMEELDRFERGRRAYLAECGLPPGRSVSDETITDRGVRAWSDRASAILNPPSSTPSVPRPAPQPVAWILA